MEYHIRLDSFEGPFDLLYYLIEENQLDISTISLQKITEQYLTYLNQMQEMDLDIASEFVVMAVELLRLKTRLLLPRVKRTSQAAIQEPDLVKRLTFYKKIRSYVKMLQSLEELGLNTFFRSPEHLEGLLERLEEKNIYDADLFRDITLEQLTAAYVKAIEFAQRREEEPEEEVEDKGIKWQEFAQEIYKINDKMLDILELTAQHPQGYNFLKFLNEMETRHEKVVSFLALLELVKLQKVRIRQDGFLAKILVEKGKDNHGKQN